MDLSLLLIAIVAILIIVFIFKIIKKIVMAIITVILFIIIFFAGIVGLIYLDISDLSEQKQFDINLMYGDSENFQFGINSILENGEVNPETIKGISEFKKEDLDELEKGKFYIFISEDLFEKLLIDDKLYYIEGTKDLDSDALDTSINKAEIKEIFNSENPTEKYIEIINSKSDLGKLGEILEPALNEAITTELEKVNLDFKGVVFASVISESTKDEKSILTLIKGFKEDELEVYPDKFSFKIIKLFPVDYIREKIESIN